ncbi:MAG: hypothetical protein LKJ21_07200 [Oscillospiraceae bacterium]|jgi:phosphoserine phosphatase|nr:hypothetical protein [Oscillospiraceae bacterium]MCI1990046.1 hypothetical protein [Oscillospiraceae bacterium]
MPEQWTAEIIGEMHLNRITAKELSAQLGYNPKYVSTILNGHRKPKKAEQMFREALNELIHQKQAG